MTMGLERLVAAGSLTIGGWLLRPLYRAVWADPARRAHKLLQFAEVEADGSRDLVRAAELTRDPVLRREFLHHARDEARHASIFRARGMALRRALGGAGGNALLPDWIAPGERRLDELPVEPDQAGELLAFIHLSESAAARDFAVYGSVLDHDPQTSAVFHRILRDEEFHMRYSLAELDRVAPGRRRRLLWMARLRRLWAGYLRLATALAAKMAAVILIAQYFILLPPFALLAKHAARRERPGWVTIQPASGKPIPPTGPR
jgi:hypothetical protein